MAKEVIDRKIGKGGKFKEYLKNALAISTIVQLTIAPIIMYFYKTVSFTFLVANILSGILISIVIIYGFIISFISFIQIDLAGLLAVPYKVLIKIFISIAEITSKIPFSKVYVKTPYIWQIIFYYILLFIVWHCMRTKQIYKIFKFKKQLIAIVLIIVIIPSLTDIIPRNNLKLYFIDVGQGDSCLVVTPKNKKLLIDRRRK